MSSTSVPEQDSLATNAEAGAELRICDLQHRFSCAIRGLHLHVPAGEPYIPAGHPVLMHNPFTGRPQCRLRTTTQGTAQVLRNTLADYASRRGWQPIIDVQPQPDSRAVHLIPAATRPDLVSVLLSAEGDLHPMCISRSFPSRGSRPYQFDGREGRVMAPYPTRRADTGPAQLRDGECFPVNFGPFGPPPPQPIHDAAACLSCWGLLATAAFLPRWHGMLLALFLLPQVTGGPPYDDRGGKPIYRISAFPWRTPAGARTAQPVCSTLQCRFTMLCPWTGTHGIYTTDSSTPLEEVWQRYRADLPGWPRQQYMPTWPGLRHDRLTLIPAAPSLDVACVVVRHFYHSRAILVPACVTKQQIARAIAHLTPWQPQEVRFPPSLLAAFLREPAKPLQLRSGDVLDVLESSDVPQTIAFQYQDMLRGYAMWTQGVGLLCNMLIRLWDAAWPRPIVTWLNPGTEWQPLLLTFDGSFRETYPGKWVPVAWGPSKILQLVRASDSPQRVHVLVEQEGKTFVTATDPGISRTMLASALQAPADGIQIVGAPEGDTDSLCVLRDGDIINSRAHQHSVPVYGWPDDDASEPGPLIQLSCALLLRGYPRLWVVLMSITHIMFADAVRHPQPERSRSGSPDSDAQLGCSPRPSRWRPDLPHPFTDVATRWFDYSILCPFQGWSQGARCLSDTSGDTVQAVLLRWCQQWAPQYMLLGSLEPRGPALVIPGGLARLACVLVFTPGSLVAQLVPRVISFRRLHAYLRRLVAGTLRVRLLPSLRVSEHGPDADVILRDGDAFEVFNDAAHTSYRPGQQLPIIPFASLPHHITWHMPFRLDQGGWVRLWSAEYRDGRASERVWIEKGSHWTPQWCQFQPPRSLPGPERWAPAVGAEDDCCHFVRQSDLGQAQVLLHDPGNSATFRCVRCPSSGGEASYPSGWRLRADLAVRSSILHLRDGDVLVPGAGPSRRRVQFRALPSLAAALLRRRGFWFLALSALASVFGEGAASMQAPSRASHYAGKCTVGKFDWRIPPHLRVCNFAVQSGATARAISPFGGTSDDVPIDPDTSYEQLTDTFLHNEPPWADHLVPIWPALAAHVLDFTFEPSHPSLATLIVVSPDWQAAFLTPSRTDLQWLLQYLRGTSSYPIFRLRPSPNVWPLGASPHEAIDWRTGDVVFVQPNEGFPQSLTPPVFVNGTHVRHRAFWGIDFHVQRPLTIVIWRPGHPYTKTTMPPGAHWLANRQTFQGEFEQRYPGSWVPVPWAYDDRPHICLRSPDPDNLHIIHERVEDNVLRGDCLVVSRWSTLSSVAGQLDLDQRSLRLLGVDGSTAGRSLRDGDITHSVDPAVAVPSSAATLPAPGICLFLLAGGHGAQTSSIGFLGLGLAWALCHLATAVPTLADQNDDFSFQWVWSPYRGKLGPYSPLSLADSNPLRSTEPWWRHGLAYVSPAPHLREAHWVPRSPSPLFANILAFGPPAPVALLLPSRLPKHLLFSVLAQYFPGLEYLSGRIPALAGHFPPETEVLLRDGDAIVTRGSRWSPTLHQQPASFANHAAARVQGCWSHPLTFHSNCWILVWRPDGHPPAAIYAEGPQHWDPAACTLRPALNSLPDGWWPSLHGGASAVEPLHLVEASGAIGCANILHWPQRSCHRLVFEDLAHWRDGDVSFSDSGPLSSFPQATPRREAPASNRATRSTGSSSSVFFVLTVWAIWSAPRWTAPGGPSWSLCLLACYLSAYGAPEADRTDSVLWERDMTAPAKLTARLHEYWWRQPLEHNLPEGSPGYAHTAWNQFPLWQGGVPSSLLIATDGSGETQGAWAFIAWGFFRGKWYRIGWAAAPLHSMPWVPSDVKTHGDGLASFYGELAALESAGLWVSAMLDLWYLQTSARPEHVTIAVDNASALQIAAGYGKTTTTLSRLTRQSWQSVQARVNTYFRHVHSHTGLLANSLADLLAGQAARHHPRCRLSTVADARTELSDEDIVHFAQLWLIPACHMRQGRPAFTVPSHARHHRKVSTASGRRVGSKLGCLLASC